MWLSRLVNGYLQGRERKEIGGKGEKEWDTFRGLCQKAGEAHMPLSQRTGHHGTSLVAQWLRLAGATRSIPGQRTGFPHAMGCSQKINKRTGHHEVKGAPQQERLVLTHPSSAGVQMCLSFKLTNRYHHWLIKPPSSKLHRVMSHMEVKKKKNQNWVSVRTGRCLRTGTV